MGNMFVEDDNREHILSEEVAGLSVAWAPNTQHWFCLHHPACCVCVCVWTREDRQRLCLYLSRPYFYHNCMLTNLARPTCQQTPGIILFLPTEHRDARGAWSPRVLYVDCHYGTWPASCFRSHMAGMLYSTGLYIPYWNGEGWEKPILRAIYYYTLWICTAWQRRFKHRKGWTPRSENGKT